VTTPIVRPEAAADIEDAYQWYEAQQAGLGEEFILAADEVIKAVVANPLQFPVIHRQTHSVLFHRFPYRIFYRIVNDEIVVVACMHGARNPRRWQSRT
jgi:plasmid stabilization system protein ParE